MAIPVLFGLSIILFLFLRLLPGGGPAEAILGQHATPQLVAQIREPTGLDKPLYVQYLNYLGRLLHGDFGSSFIDGRQVLDDVPDPLPGDGRADDRGADLRGRPGHPARVGWPPGIPTAGSTAS